MAFPPVLIRTLKFVLLQLEKWTPWHYVHIGTLLLQLQYVLIFFLQADHLIFTYSVFVLVHPLSSVFHIQVWVGLLTSSCPGLPGPVYCFLRQIGELILTPSSSKLFSKITWANFLWNSIWGSGIAFLPRALEYTALASTTEQIKVNCRVGHHFVCQT